MAMETSIDIITDTKSPLTKWGKRLKHLHGKACFIHFGKPLFYMGEKIKVGNSRNYKIYDTTEPFKCTLCEI